MHSVGASVTLNYNHTHYTHTHTHTHTRAFVVSSGTLVEDFTMIFSREWILASRSAYIGKNMLITT